MALTFDEALPRLVAAYEGGRLVPFIGAGMSVPACRGWEALVRELATVAKCPPALQLKRTASPEEIVRAANWAVRTLKLNQGAVFSSALRRALFTVAAEPPPQTVALAAIWWPLVVTTNYDDLYVSAREARETAGGRQAAGRLTVLGRRPHHCQRVLSSLFAPAEPILWALQGFLGRPAGPAHIAPDSLEGELVVGHEEYRRVTHTEPHFRRAFAEIFRNRSLLFLGSGLRDQYLMELFGETLETFGPNPFPHYAFIQEGEADAGFLRARFNIFAIEYTRGKHSTVRSWLDRFARQLSGGRWRPTRWSYSSNRILKRARETGDVEIIRGRLPLPVPGECVALSAGVAHRRPFLGAGMRHYREMAERHGLLDPECRCVRPAGARYVWSFAPPARSAPPDPASIFLVVARGRSNTKDVRVIARAVEELLEQVSAQGSFHVLRMPLAAAGGSQRRYPPRAALVETLRGFARWRSANPTSPLRLAIHLVHPSVLFELSTGKIDVLSLLSCADDVPFWLEVSVGAQIAERQFLYKTDRVTIGGLAEEFGLVGSRWIVEVDPAPSVGWHDASLSSVRRKQLGELGILPGSTLRFHATRGRSAHAPELEVERVPLAEPDVVRMPERIPVPVTHILRAEGRAS
ncbi:MAG: SIR2 family protein [Gemmatimonadaceae bacterium]